MTKFISIVSGKGGVGKTTTAINLGAALSSLGKEVLVVDGNTATPDIGLHLGATKFPFTLHDVLNGKKTLRDAVYIHSSGLKYVPASISLDDAKNTEIENLPSVMLDLYGATDIVIIDGAAGIGKEAMSVVKASDEAIIVTNPDIPSVTDAIKMARMIKENGTKIYGVVLTRVCSDNDVSENNVSVLLDAPLLGTIPEDSAIKKALSMKQPVVFSHPDSDSSVAYKKLAAEMLGQKYIPSVQKKGFFARLFSGN